MKRLKECLVAYLFTFLCVHGAADLLRVLWRLLLGPVVPWWGWAITSMLGGYVVWGLFEWVRRH